MSPASSRRAARSAFAARRREVERGLAGPALRPALESLGPVFAAFGAYLGSRPDLLPLGDCLELAATEVHVPATPPQTVRARIAEELGQSVEDLFASFDDTPCRCLLMAQWHQARLPDGRRAVVKLVHPNLEERLGFDLELLPLLGGFPGSAAADFAAGLERQADFLAELQALAAMGLPVRTPEVVAPLSRPKLLCLVDGPGSFAPLSGRAGEARRLALAWLRLALTGPAFPVELRPEDVRWLPDGRIGFAAQAYGALPSEVRADLLACLHAAAGDDPGDAAAPLMRLMEPRSDSGIGPEMEAELRRRFRQAVPLRDGGWSGDGPADLAQHLFLHWRLATEQGLRPRPPVIAFYRGFLALWSIARGLDPVGDPVGAAAGDLRALEVLEQLQDLLDPGRLPRRLEDYAAVGLSLPGRMDAVLGLGSGDRPPLRLRVDPPPARSRRPGSPALIAALLLALAGLALLSRRFVGEAALEPWGDIVSATLFLILGGLLLRAIGRPG